MMSYQEIIKGVKVICNLPSHPELKILRLTDHKVDGIEIDTSRWHTDWGDPGTANPEQGHYLKLLFGLGQVHEVDDMEYVPRTDAGNGTLLQVQYRLSCDGENWTPLSGKIHWNRNNSVKTIKLGGNKFKYMELQVLKSVVNMGSGRHVYFHKYFASTKEDSIKGVKVTCNFPCLPVQEIRKLTDNEVDDSDKNTSRWHTNWGSQGQANPEQGHYLKLHFDLKYIYEVDDMEYVPRTDAGNGTLLKIQYRHSSDGENWTPLSGKIHWNQTNSVKTIKLGGKKLRYMELQVLESVENLGSGRHVYFHKYFVSTKENSIKGVKVTCNFPCQPGVEIHRLTDHVVVNHDNDTSRWHTRWSYAGKTNPETGHLLKLNFDLGHIYEVADMEYVPCTDAGNGTLLQVQYRLSCDGKNWTPLSGKIHWNRNNSVKTIKLGGNKLRYMELLVLESVENLGSGRHVYFIKKF